MSQVGGKHYEEMAVQPWDVMAVLLTREEFIGFLKGNIIKYSMRQGRKEGSDDGAKAAHYIEKLLGVLCDDEDDMDEPTALQSVLVGRVDHGCNGR